MSEMVCDIAARGVQRGACAPVRDEGKAACRKPWMPQRFRE
jgi:hypothetical protein